ncbi:MAG: hypothetical protein ACK52J_04245 [bacterium]|jgi:hypothetical protein
MVPLLVPQNKSFSNRDINILYMTTPSVIGNSTISSSKKFLYIDKYFSLPAAMKISF